MFVRARVALGLVCAAILGCGASQSASDLDASGPDGCTLAIPVADAVADAGDASATAAGYTAITIRDRSADPAFINGKCGSSPGADIDCVGLYRDGKLIAVGKPGTAAFAPAPNATCANPRDVTAATAEGALDGHVYGDPLLDTGYISLNGGALTLQFGACSGASNITNCHGEGGVVTVLPGDEIDVWEVDSGYLTGSSTAADGNAWSGCTCYADEYEVDLTPSAGGPPITLPRGCGGNGIGGRWYAGTATVAIP